MLNPKSHREPFNEERMSLKTHPFWRTVRSLCEQHPMVLRLGAFGLPGLGLGAWLVLSQSPNEFVGLLGRNVAPVWMLGGPLCATLVTVFDQAEQPRSYARLINWVFMVVVSLLLAFPLAMATGFIFFLLTS